MYSFGECTPLFIQGSRTNAPSTIDTLLGTTAILVAHPDDESIAFGGVLQRIKQPYVLFTTDGAPRKESFWKPYRSRDDYASVRRQEASEALNFVKAPILFLSDYVEQGIADQELYSNLKVAIRVCEKFLDDIRPDCLLTLAYEGGHPDHDASCFMAALIGKRRALPVWESPLYHSRINGSMAIQEFSTMTGLEIELAVENDALEKKLSMIHAYQSQSFLRKYWRPGVERFRPMAEYDFARRPMPWKLNYERWGWPMTGDAVAKEFQSLLRSEPEYNTVTDNGSS